VGTSNRNAMRREQRNISTISTNSGIVNLSKLDDENKFSVIYAKFWTQLTLVIESELAAQLELAHKFAFTPLGMNFIVDNGGVHISVGWT
jgi:hypothetical protein